MQYWRLQYPDYIHLVRKLYLESYGKMYTNVTYAHTMLRPQSVYKVTDILSNHHILYGVRMTSKTVFNAASQLAPVIWTIIFKRCK